MSEWHEIRVGLYENLEDGSEVVIEQVDYGVVNFGENLWNVRDKVPPPAKGFEMFADSAPDINVAHLLDQGYEPHQIMITNHECQDAVWINKEA